MGVALLVLGAASIGGLLRLSTQKEELQKKPA